MWRPIFENTAVGYALMDEHGRFAGATRGLAEMLGCTCEQVIGRTAAEAFGLHESALSVKVTERAREPVLILSNGSRFRWSTEPLSINGFSASYSIGILRDESALESLEFQLTHRDRLATLGSLTASLTHEIAAPLTIIANNAEMLLDDVSVDEARQCLTLILDEAQRLGTLLREFLSFVHDAPLNTAAQDAVELVKKSVQMLRYQPDCRKAIYRIEAEPDLPPLAGDAEHLQQVLFNLISNACDALPEGGQININVRRADTLLADGREAIEISITDDGQGIAAFDLERVFEPFYSTKPPGKGTGLGLPIARRIVTAHGGQLHLASSPGEGTRASLLLPVWTPTINRTQGNGMNEMS